MHALPLYMSKLFLRTWIPLMSLFTNEPYVGFCFFILFCFLMKADLVRPLLETTLLVIHLSS